MFYVFTFYKARLWLAMCHCASHSAPDAFTVPPLRANPMHLGFFKGVVLIKEIGRKDIPFLTISLTKHFCGDTIVGIV
jgi:hypothetical protein